MFQEVNMPFCIVTLRQYARTWSRHILTICLVFASVLIVFAHDLRADSFGDVNNDHSINLNDAMDGLQVISGKDKPADLTTDADINGDSKLGMEEVLYILRRVALSRDTADLSEFGDICEGGISGIREAPPLGFDLPYRIGLLKNHVSHHWNIELPAEWQPDSIQNTHLFGCMSNDYADLVERCEYSPTGQGYPTAYVYRYRYCNDLAVYIAATGEKMDQRRICGSNPEPCPGVISGTYSVYGPAPTTDKAIEYLTPYMSRYVIQTPQYRIYGGLAYDGEYLWVIGTDSEYVNTIYQFDISGNVVKSFPAPCRSPLGLAWDGESLWVGSGWLDDKFYKIDVNGEVLYSFTFSENIASGGLAYDGTHFFALGGYPDKIYKVDKTGNIIEEIEIPEFIDDRKQLYGLTYDGSHFWASCRDGNIYQFDRSMKVTKTLPGIFEVATSGVTGMAFDGNALWVAYMSGDYIFRLDPSKF